MSCGLLRHMQYLAGTTRYRARTQRCAYKETHVCPPIQRLHSRTSAQQHLVQLLRTGQQWHRTCMLLCPTHPPPTRAWACFFGFYRREKVCVSLNLAWLQSYHQAEEWCKLHDSNVCGFCGKAGEEVLSLKRGIKQQDLPNPARRGTRNRGTRPCFSDWLPSKCHACRLTVQP